MPPPATIQEPNFSQTILSTKQIGAPSIITTDLHRKEHGMVRNATVPAGMEENATERMPQNLPLVVNASLNNLDPSPSSAQSSPRSTPSSGARPTTAQTIAPSAPSSARSASGSSRKRTISDFELGGVIGSGSYSSVHVVKEHATGAVFALKVLDKKHIIKENKVKYVHIEKAVLNLSRHPFITRLAYTFQDSSSLYFVLELCPNGELLSLIQEKKGLPTHETQFVIAEILTAVEYLHSRGVLHRDLKPENVLMDKDWHIKLADFGTAKMDDVERPGNNKTPMQTTTPPPSAASTDSSMEKRQASDASSSASGHPSQTQSQDTTGTSIESASIASSADKVQPTLTRRHSFVGTAEYVSPELLGEKATCFESDLWAIGCILYQCMVGKPPFKGPNDYQTFQRISKLQYSWPENWADNEGRDLTESILRLEVNERLGAARRYADIKKHPFFNGLDWNKLWNQTSPLQLWAIENNRPPQHEFGNPLSSSESLGLLINFSEPQGYTTAPRSTGLTAAHTTNGAPSPGGFTVPSSVPNGGHHSSFQGVSLPTGSPILKPEQHSLSASPLTGIGSSSVPSSPLTGIGSSSVPSSPLPVRNKVMISPSPEPIAMTTSDWSRFLKGNETEVKVGHVLQRPDQSSSYSLLLTSTGIRKGKPRLLILTSMPRLLVIDEDRDVLKHEVHFPPTVSGAMATSSAMGAGVVFPSKRGGNAFEVCDGRSKGKRVFTFEDVTAEGVKSWIATIGNEVTKNQ